MKLSYSQIKSGHPFPLGATRVEGGWNFSVYSDYPVHFLYIAPIENSQAIEEIPFDPETNKTGHIWHIFIETDKESLYYGFCVGQHLLIDPYAQTLDSGSQFGENSWQLKPKKLFAIASCKKDEESNFDWEGDKPLQIPQNELIIYEMHVRGFTQHSSSKALHPGTYLGVIEKIPHLKELGITAVELLPIQDFDETEYDKINPKTKERLYNYWGYSPLNFFAPMPRYATSNDPQGVMRECKEMVKALHKARIEVILDVVFNHTGEGNEHGKCVSWKGFAPDVYYFKGEGAGEGYLNFSGCGNTLQCNQPVVQDLIIKALRHWVIEYHVDGFRFDLASILARGRDGRPLADPPLLERITRDPILREARLIAEPWDAAGMHQVGSFYQSVYQGERHWMEWNDDFRSTVRRFLKGDEGLAGRFATKLCGSQDIYGKDASPVNSVNFITCHDGFTLHDLVSYNHKHNLANGEENRDGANNNDSWNSGAEGATKICAIQRLRERQMKNFILALMVAQGVPMLFMGDEYAHTKLGNNNTWCQDNKLNWFLWDELALNQSFYHFYKELIHFRKTHPILSGKKFLQKNDIEWHGKQPFQPDWSHTSHLVAFTLKDQEGGGKDLYIAFNACQEEAQLSLPSLSIDKEWVWVVNTQKAPSQDFRDPERHQKVEGPKIKLGSYSAIVLQAYLK